MDSRSKKKKTEDELKKLKELSGNTEGIAALFSDQIVEEEQVLLDAPAYDDSYHMKPGYGRGSMI